MLSWAARGETVSKGRVREPSVRAGLVSLGWCRKGARRGWVCALRGLGRYRTFLGVFCEDVADVVRASRPKDLNEALGSTQACSREAVHVIAVVVLGWLLAVTDHVDGRRLA
jgi:hypothetical protein